MAVAAIFFSFLLHASVVTRDIEPPSGHVRTYYIAAEEVQWNYAPRGTGLTGVPVSESGRDERAPKREVFLKAVYHEYTDATFSTRKPRPPAWEHLGILGPLIRAEVGDTVKVYFKNKTKIFCTMHPHGLSYEKDSEGAFYNDGTSGAQKADDAVPPGGTHLYIWRVPDSAGPAKGETSSILWMYHSHFNEPRDVNTGLLGPIIVSARGTARPDGTPRDVDREFVTAFAVFDETESWYFDSNAMHARKYSPNLKYTDPAFRESFLRYTINGFIDSNLSVMTMKKGERVRWYLFASSNEDDVHTPHWHGQTVVFNHMRTDIVHLEPMTMAVADMIPEHVGTWLFHCHVNEHLEGGMAALFRVVP